MIVNLPYVIFLTKSMNLNELPYLKKKKNTQYMKRKNYHVLIIVRSWIVYLCVKKFKIILLLI